MFVKKGKLKCIARPRYDPTTGQFLGLYESLGFIVVRQDPDRHFMDYGYCKKNSKMLHSYHKRRIPSSFSGTLFSLKVEACRLRILMLLFLAVDY